MQLFWLPALSIPLTFWLPAPGSLLFPLPSLSLLPPHWPSSVCLCPLWTLPEVPAPDYILACIYGNFLLHPTYEQSCSCFSFPFLLFIHKPTGYSASSWGEFQNTTWSHLNLFCDVFNKPGSNKKKQKQKKGRTLTFTEGSSHARHLIGHCFYEAPHIYILGDRKVGGYK